jgi:hypothetical protein
MFSARIDSVSPHPFQEDPMISLCLMLLAGLPAQEVAAPVLKEVRFNDLARAVRDLKGQVLVVDIWHRT